MNFAELDLTLRPAATNAIVADIRLRLPDNTVDTILTVGTPVLIDNATLLAVQHDPKAYGRALTAQLFADRRMREAWAQSYGFTQGRGIPLQLRLRLDPNVEALHAIRWETLQEPQSGQAMCLSERILFSRYVYGGDLSPVRHLRRKAIRALVVASNPTDLDQYDLPALDVVAEIDRASQTLGDLPLTCLASTADHDAPTRHRLLEALSNGADIVYLICHGTLTDGIPYLWLERENGTSEPVSGVAIAQHIASLDPAKRPGLVVVAACQSAGTDEHGVHPSALGPLLTRAGVHSVIAMQGAAPVSLVAQLIPTFFQQLLSDGRVDRALAAARACLPEEQPWWMPVLFLRTVDSRLWVEGDSTASAEPVQFTFQQPRVSEHYVSRMRAEASLRTALTAPEIAPIVVLHGMSGLGKTSLAARVAHALEADGLVAGVFWGCLDHLTPNDLLLQFLGSLEQTWYQRSIDNRVTLRDAFWEALRKRDHPLLVVFDQVTDAQQLAELLPTDPKRLGRCHVLALAVRRLKIPGLGALVASDELGGLTPEEALALFGKLVTPGWVVQHEPTLREIAQRLGNVPQLLVFAARDMLAGSLSPATYLRRLTEGRHEHQLLDTAVTGALEVAIRDLSPAQVELLEFTGVLGEGDWHYRMLAAVAQRPAEEIRPDLAHLVERDLLRVAGVHRFRANTLVREFALQRLSRHPSYVRLAAATLLARHCLDLSHDAFVQVIRQRQHVEPLVAQPIDELEVQVFRKHLQPELSHLRRALHWAVEQQTWDLLRRFAYIPALELLANFVTNRYEVQMLLTLATIWEPVVRASEAEPSVAYTSFITSADWTLTSQDDELVERLRPNGSERPQIDLSDKNRASRRCEVVWNITAGHIVDGVLTQTCLVDSSWKGVRAPGLICRQVDIVGSQMLACDLSSSVFFDCDARQVQLLGSDLRDVLLVDVRLHGADLRSINARGARFECVDMRGVDLRDASLVGAILEEVDLRGSDLRGADFSHVSLRQVKLHGCQLQGVVWAGAQFDDDSRIEDVVQQQVIDESRAQPPEPYEAPSVVRDKPEQFMRDDARGVVVLTGQDVRARRLAGWALAQVTMDQADLRASIFDKAQLEDCTAEAVDARGASFREAELAHARLGRADLRAVDLSQADLSSAHLEYAVLRSAVAVHARLPRAHLQGAALQYANLSNADLRKADLRGAQLTKAILVDADLSGADLRRANLRGADLRGALLHGAQCDGAHGAGANLEGARIKDVQLAALGALGGTTLPDGSIPKVFSGMFEAAPEEANLHFTQWSGTFLACQLQNLHLFGAYLDGKFVECGLDGVHLEHGHLVGIFADCTMINAHLAGARLHGIFSNVDFSGANLRDADLTGASFVNCTMNKVAVTPEQLQTASRLRGTIFEERIYAGDYRLEGDLDDARQAGIDLSDSDAMWQHFYSQKTVHIKKW